MIYILSIHRIPTGGPETLHQFAMHLRNNGANVAMVYSDTDSTEPPEKFKIYNVPVVKEIIDSEENLLIVPETMTRYLYNYKKIRKCIWWLSLDFYYGYNSLEGLMRCAERQKINKLLWPVCLPMMYVKHKMVGPYFKFGKDKNEIFHLYNCEYARLYLEKHHVHESNTMYMCGPIRDEYFEKERKEKQKIVTYNPKKNLDFTKRILKVLEKERPDIRLVGITGMKPYEIADLLAECSVYIDFGHFPGPERIPREAVTCYCNIVTSKYGSAKNDKDVLVPSKYKFKATGKNIKKIVSTVIELVDNYNLYVEEYDAYREKVRGQVELFENNAKKFLDLFS